MSETRVCAACGGAGFIVVGAGLAALEARYPDLPVREMERRGWLGDVGDGEDVERVDRAFLAFWRVASHDDVWRIIGRARQQSEDRDG